MGADMSDSINLNHGACALAAFLEHLQIETHMQALKWNLMQCLKTFNLQPHPTPHPRAHHPKNNKHISTVYK